MTKSLQSSAEYNKFYYLIVNAIFFICYFLWFWFQVDPKIIYQYQEPVFFYNIRFFNEHLLYPGGVVDYISAFLAQFYYFTWIGSMMVTVFAILTTYLTRWLIQNTGTKIKGDIISFLPALLLLACHSQYEFLLNFTIGFLLALLFSFLYIRFMPKIQVTRFLIYILSSLLLYFLVGGAFFLFVILCGLFELLLARRYILGVLIILSSVGLPYLAASFIFLVSMRLAYIYLLPFDYINEKIYLLRIALYAFYPLILIVQGVITFLNLKKVKAVERNRLTSLRSRVGPRLNMTLQVIVLIFLLAVTAFLSYEEGQKDQLMVDHYAQSHEWQQVLETVKGTSRLDLEMIFQANRAFYHLGLLSSDMFDLPQIGGTHGLFMTQDDGFIYPLQNSDFYFDLGFINEAEHWAHEAMSIRGETGWTLERLALVSIVKGEIDAAHVFISKLNQSLLFRRNANQLRQLLNDTTKFSRYPNILDIRSRMPHPEHDFIYYTVSPDITLEGILKNSPSNKMAFEYLMAFHLLNGNLGKFVNEIVYLKDLGYTNIPRHYQEALLLYFAVSGKSDLPSLEGYKINGEIIKRFKNFQDILRKFHGDKNLARNELYKYHGNTYWFYTLYYRPKEH
ncbi:MAG: DUF6057 family protein [Bacteroidota bacterium]